MADVYGPILPLQLDPRNLTDIVRAIQTRIYLESGEKLNDFTPASPLSAVSEGFGFAQAELLYYLNTLPEAFSVQWLRQLGVQRRIGSKAMAEVTFYRTAGYDRVVIIPSGTKLYSTNGLMFILSNEVRLSSSSATGVVISEKWGSVYNVNSDQINKIERNFTGLESLSNVQSAVGGRDLESLDDMKQRAFEVLSRRNLTTAGDFETQVRAVAPEAEILKVLTYEERYNIDPASVGKVLIVAGRLNGEELSVETITKISDSLRNRVNLGTTASVIAPDITPVTCSVEVFYDPAAQSDTTDMMITDLYNTLLDHLDPTYLGLGQDLLYQPLLREVYSLGFVEKVNILDTKVMIRNPSNLEGVCAGFSGTETDSGCVYDYSVVINADNQTYTSPSPISSFRLYNAFVTLTSSKDFTSVTYNYRGIYNL